jgi:hypothetical protein
MPFSFRFSALTTLTALLAACAASAPPPQEATAETGPTACPETRPQVCTMIYAPVCAAHSDGRRETHASACNACADETALSYTDGPCEESTQ